VRGYDPWLWLLQRVTAGVLVAALALHFWFLHYQQPGAIIDYSNVAVRLRTVLFVTVDLSLLACGLLHGLNGLYQVLLDFGLRGRVQVWTARILVLLGVLVFVLGLSSVLKFAVTA